MVRPATLVAGALVFGPLTMTTAEAGLSDALAGASLEPMVPHTERTAKSLQIPRGEPTPMVPHTERTAKSLQIPRNAATLEPDVPRTEHTAKTLQIPRGEPTPMGPHTERTANSLQIPRDAATIEPLVPHTERTAKSLQIPRGEPTTVERPHTEIIMASLMTPDWHGFHLSSQTVIAADGTEPELTSQTLEVVSSAAVSTSAIVDKMSGGGDGSMVKYGTFVASLVVAFVVMGLVAL